MASRDLAAPSVALATAVFFCIYGFLAVPYFALQTFMPWSFLWSVVLAATLAWLSAIDLREFRLPDAVTLSLAVAGLLGTWVRDPASFWWHVASALAAFGVMFAIAYVYERIRAQRGLGLGDAKLLAASGAWLGAEGLPGVLLWASGSALVGVLIARLRGAPIAANTRIPFGPFIAFGTWLVWLYGPI